MMSANLVLMAARLECLHQEVQSLPVVLDVRCESSLIANCGCILPITFVDHLNVRLRFVLIYQKNLLQMMVNFTANSHCLFERLSAHWKNHEFLHGQFVACMRTTIDDVECRDRKNDL